MLIKNYAKLDENNIIIDVIVIDKDLLKDNDSTISEMFGGQWIELSDEDTPGKIAGIGFSYDNVNNIFIPPKTFDSWIFNEELANWVSPVPYPKDINSGEVYDWDEETVSWVIR
jgi:hypothetical protein